MNTLEETLAFLAPGSGKTEFVTEIAAHAVLPRARDGVRYDGSEARVIVIDCDGKFDQLRLLRALNRKIEEKLANVRENQRVTMEMRCTRNRCRDSRW